MPACASQQFLRPFSRQTHADRQAGRQDRPAGRQAGRQDRPAGRQAGVGVGVGVPWFYGWSPHPSTANSAKPRPVNFASLPPFQPPCHGSPSRLHPSCGFFWPRQQTPIHPSTPTISSTQAMGVPASRRCPLSQDHGKLAQTNASPSARHFWRNHRSPRKVLESNNGPCTPGSTAVRLTQAQRIPQNHGP